jgi:hypothetical protein
MLDILMELHWDRDCEGRRDGSLFKNRFNVNYIWNDEGDIYDYTEIIKKILIFFVDNAECDSGGGDDLDILRRIRSIINHKGTNSLFFDPFENIFYDASEEMHYILRYLKIDYIEKQFNIVYSEDKVFKSYEFTRVD